MSIRPKGGSMKVVNCPCGKVVEAETDDEIVEGRSACRRRSPRDGRQVHAGDDPFDGHMSRLAGYGPCLVGFPGPCLVGLGWARLDSNPGPTDYELRQPVSARLGTTGFRLLIEDPPSARSMSSVCFGRSCGPDVAQRKRSTPSVAFRTNTGYWQCKSGSAISSASVRLSSLGSLDRMADGITMWGVPVSAADAGNLVALMIRGTVDATELAARLNVTRCFRSLRARRARAWRNSEAP